MKTVPIVKLGKTGVYDSTRGKYGSRNSSLTAE